MAPQEAETRCHTLIKENEDIHADDTESEIEEHSVKIASKPSRLNFGDSIQLKKQTSMTPVHQAAKSFGDQSDKKLIVQIEGTSSGSLNCSVKDDSCSAKDEKPELNSVQSSSVQANEFVKTPKVQSLIRQIIRLKAARDNKKNLKSEQPTQVTEKQIELKQREINVDQAALSARIKEMIDSSMIFAQLKQQPGRLLQKKSELVEQEKEIRAQLAILDENYNMTMKYIQSEESTQKVNQDQI